MKPLLAIRHQPTAPLGVIEDALNDAGVVWRYIDPWRGDPVPGIDGAAAFIVLGGEMNADEVERYPWLADTRQLLRAAVEQDVPILGVCLGAQLLARAGDAEVVRGRQKEIGFRKVDVLPDGADDPLLRAFAPSSLAFQFHEDQCRLPAGAQLLATNDDCEVQAFRLGARAYGVQFHFEVTTREIMEWCDEMPPDVLRDVWGATKDELLAQAEAHLEAQQARGRDLATAFLDIAQLREAARPR